MRPLLYLIAFFSACSGIARADDSFLIEDANAPKGMERIVNFTLAAKVSLGAAAPRLFNSEGKLYFEAHSSDLDDRLLKEITSKPEVWFRVTGGVNNYINLHYVGKVECTGLGNPIKVTLIGATTPETVSDSSAVSALRKALNLP